MRGTLRRWDMTSLARLDAVAQAASCARGDLSADELLTACLSRVETLNPLLRAVVTLAPEEPRASGRAAARAAEAMLFAGVPFLVKDVMPWPGMRRAMGSRLFARNAGRGHTPYSRALTDAGLVCVGKTAMSELGLLASTETVLEGVTHNPWDLSLSAGGSSGGSAVAVAAGLVPVAHASDGGGSIRVPASVCGVFGFKPTGRRSLSTTTANSDFQAMTVDHCLSRSVRDSAVWLAQTEARSDDAPMNLVHAPSRPSRRLRIATWTRTLWGDEPEPAVRRAYDETCALLTQLGHEVEPTSAPDFGDDEADRLVEAFFLVGGAAVAAVIDGIDRTRAEPVQRHELEPFTWSLAEDFLGRGDDPLTMARASFARAVKIYADAIRGYDVVFTPTLPIVPWRLGHLSPLVSHAELKRRTRLVLGYTPIHNIARCPAMSVPLCFTKEGLPVGMHFAAAPDEDVRLMSLAYELEAARPWADRWPPYAIPSLG